VTGFPRTLIIVPAYNEEESLADVIKDLRFHAPWADVAVVNDGSHDGTPDIARAHGVILLNLPYNLGIGGAVQTGYKYAARMGYEVAVQVDGDGQHPPAEIVRLVEALVSTEANMVVGSRFVGEGDYRSPLARLLGIRILSAVVSLLAGQRLTDTTSGFRAVDREVLRLLARVYPRDYPEPEAIILLRRQGFRIVEVPVTMRQRIGGRSSISRLKGLYYMVKVLLATVVDVFEDRVCEREAR
jgi:glycosyltransferase involved in cell wall biosynthesis